MSSSGQSGRFAVFYERVKRVVTNTTFQWFIGLLVAIALALMQMQGEENGKKDDGPEKPLHQVEETASQQQSPDYQHQGNMTESDDQAFSQNYTVIEHQPLFIREAHTNLSVIFQNFEGEEFVSLNIAPEGEKSSVRAALRGYTEEFTSSTGVFYVQILDIDYKKRKVAVQVSRKK
ncbi:hypothetical protein VU04_09085 [Desulfobulbus sp. TB]|nr:hypothetical protein [Desulfobulbus sp. TB]